MSGTNEVPNEGHKDAFIWIDPKTIQIHKNPRQRNNEGFTVEKMAALKGDIRDNGHKLPLEIRYEEGDPNPWLIAGERRWRSISQLLEENAMCFNRVTRKMEPASQVYGRVCCIETKTDATNALALAALENLLHVPLNDYEILLHCQLLQEAGMSRQELAEKLKCSEAWISQTFSLLDPEKCNPKVLEAMAEGILGRTTALQFLNFTPDKVEAVLERAVTRWKADELAKTEAAIKERDELLDQWEKSDDKLREAEDTGDTDAAAAARRELGEAEEKMAQADKNVDKVKKNKKNKPKPSMEQIQEAARDEGAEGTAQRHMPMKTLRAYADKIKDVLDTPDAEIVNPVTGQTVSRREIKIVLDVCDCILSRNDLRTPLDALFCEDDENPYVLPAKAEVTVTEEADGDLAVAAK